MHKYQSVLPRKATQWSSSSILRLHHLRNALPGTKLAINTKVKPSLVMLPSRHAPQGWRKSMDSLSTFWDQKRNHYLQEISLRSCWGWEGAVWTLGTGTHGCWVIRKEFDRCIILVMCILGINELKNSIANKPVTIWLVCMHPVKVELSRTIALEK